MHFLSRNSAVKENFFGASKEHGQVSVNAEEKIVQKRWS